MTRAVQISFLIDEDDRDKEATKTEKVMDFIEKKIGGYDVSAMSGEQ